MHNIQSCGWSIIYLVISPFLSISFFSNLWVLQVPVNNDAMNILIGQWTLSFSLYRPMSLEVNWKESIWEQAPCPLPRCFPGCTNEGFVATGDESVPAPPPILRILCLNLCYLNRMNPASQLVGHLLSVHWFLLKCPMRYQYFSQLVICH